MHVLLKKLPGWKARPTPGKLPSYQHLYTAGQFGHYTNDRVVGADTPFNQDGCEYEGNYYQHL